MSADRVSREFIVFCDAVEEAGLVVYARRGRVVARALLEALEALAAERSARVAIQAERDRLREILMRRGAAVCNRQEREA